jgi:hypothetical protein
MSDKAPTRLSVLINADCEAVLRERMETLNTSATEVVRQAFGALKYLLDNPPTVGNPFHHVTHSSESADDVSQTTHPKGGETDGA